MKDAAAFTTWLYRIAHGKAMLDGRRNGRAPTTTPDVEQIADESDDSFSPEDAAAIHAALDQLEPTHREVIVLRFLEELSYDDIAQIVGCPVGTVRSRIHYAKSKLQQLLKRNDNLLLANRIDHRLPFSEALRSHAMLDKTVGDALLRLDLTPPTDPPAAQIERVIDADRRRVKRWTRIAIALWILAAIGAFLTFILGNFTFPVIAKLLQEERQAVLVGKDTPDTKIADTKLLPSGEKPDLRGYPNAPLLLLAKLTALCLVFGSASFMILVLAGLATVLLLHRTRSATLRQINANLLQISEQLKNKPPGSAHPA